MYKAGMVFPALARTFRLGMARAVWLREGAVVIPLLAFLKHGAGKEAVRALHALFRKNSNHYRGKRVVLPVPGWTSKALGQVSEDRVVMDEMVVTARGVPSLLSETPGGVGVVAAGEIFRQQPVSVADVTYPDNSRRMASLVHTFLPGNPVRNESILNLYFQEIDRNVRIDQLPSPMGIAGIFPSANHQTWGLAVV